LRVSFRLVLDNPDALEVAPGRRQGILSDLPEFVLVNGLVFVSRGDMVGGELGVKPHGELPDSGLNLGL
jgi:hypothetical protein